MFTWIHQRSWFLILVILITVQLACQATQGEAPSTSVPPLVEETEAVTLTSAPATYDTEPDPGSETNLPSDPNSTVCLGTAEAGLVCLEGDRWQTYSQDNSSLGGNYILDLASCGDGSLLVAHTSGIDQQTSSGWSTYEAEWGYSSPDAVTCDAENGFWVGHFEGVSYFDGQAWQEHPSSSLATGSSANDLVEDVLVSPDGKVWVATSSSVAVYDGSSWTIFQEGQGFDSPYFFGNLASGPEGELWAAHSSGLLKYDGSAWTDNPNPEFGTVNGLAVDSQGRGWVGTSSGVFLLDGQNWTTYNRDNQSLSSDSVQAIVVDGKDRVWAGTSWGLNVFDGANWQAFRMDNAELSDNNIRAIALNGCCQSIPTTVEKPAGSMTGRVVYEDGSSLANTTVEICVETLGFMYFGDTPCSDQPYFQGTTTDGDGNFSFGELPSGYYVITINLGDEWAQLETEFGISSERVLVNPGEETYVGELLVDTEE